LESEAVYLGKYLPASRWNHITLCFGWNNDVFDPEDGGRKVRLQLRCASTKVHGVRSRKIIIFMCAATRLSVRTSHQYWQ